MNQPSTSHITFNEYAHFLKRRLRERASLFLLLAVTLLVSLGLQLANPELLRFFIDTAQAGGAIDLLTRTALLFIGIAVLQQLIGLVTVYLTENLAWATTNDLRLELAGHCLGLDMSFYANHPPGEMIERIDGDTMALATFFSQYTLQILWNVLLIVGILVVLLLEDWRIGLPIGIFVIIALLVLLRLANIAVPNWQAERQASADLFGFLEEQLSGTEDIRANNAQGYVLNRFYRLTRELMHKTIRAGLTFSILFNSTWVLFAIGNGLALLVGAYLFKIQAITLGTVYMITYYVNMLTSPLRAITQQMQDFQKAGASVLRIVNLERIQSKIPGENDFSMPTTFQLDPGPIGVEFKQVTFDYGNGVGAALNPAVGQLPAIASDTNRVEPEQEQHVGKELTLRDISFCIKPNRVIGVLGRTGSGKTTITRLLFRLYDPNRGSIHLGSGINLLDIRQIPVHELRRRVGMVTQSVQLFHATVRENLTFFDQSIADEKILEALRDLDLWTWYLSLPKGLDTELESGGGGLSAGEAQLLALTRIFLRDPGLVILDEATSRLDPATEHLIEQAVAKLIRNRTAIIVAHRLKTVQRADDILILENGRVSEYGERIRLVKDPSSRFCQLLEAGLEEVLV